MDAERVMDDERIDGFDPQEIVDPDDVEIVYDIEEEEARDQTPESEDEAMEIDADGVVEIIDGDAVDDEEVASLREQLNELRESYLRKLAEFDNFRKRTEREREEFNRTAGEGIVRELIPVLDNFERAVQHASDTDPEAFRLGVEMIAKQLFDMLQRQGLESIDPEGEPFEPEFHEAIQRVEDSEHTPGTVAWVLAKGYLFGGKLLRPAMVGVAVEPSEPAETTDLQVEGEAEGEDAS
jgi:molecular chaperone GrpE